MAGLPTTFTLTVTALVSVATIYMLYVANIVGLETAKAVNYGYAYAGANPQISENYFQRALNLPFNFDPIQTASKYTDFAVGLANSPGTQSQDFIKQKLINAIVAQQAAITRVPNDPTAYMELDSLYWTQAMLNKTSLDPAALQAAQTAVSLAPNRPDPELTLAQVQIFENNLAGAQQTLEQLIQTVPQDSSAKLELARLYLAGGKTDQALMLGQQALDAGFTPAQASQIDWLAQAYVLKNNWPAAEKIYQLAIKIEPNNIGEYWQLAQVEAKLGKKDMALRIAQALLQADQANAKQYQDFINSLK